METVMETTVEAVMKTSIETVMDIPMAHQWRQ
jgi:hypothetical protein